MPPIRSVTGLSSLKCPARHFCRNAHWLGALSRRCVDRWAREAERDASARLCEQPKLSRRTGSRRRAGAVQERRDGGGSVTTSRIFIRPPHFEQTVTSTAKTRARRCAQPMRRGVVVASRRPSGRPVSKSSESCVGASGCGGDGMTRARRRWRLANTP